MDIFEHEIIVRWGDCDPAQIVYTGRIPNFAIEAIESWWMHHLGHGWFEMELDKNFGTPFVSMQLDFRSPITPRHKLICRVWPNHMGNTSVGFAVKGYQNDKLCFEGSFRNVFIVPLKLKKTHPPEAIRQLIEDHLIKDSQS